MATPASALFRPGPQAAYWARLEGGQLDPDPAQAEAALRLQALYDQLLTSQEPQSATGLKAWLRRLRPIQTEPLKGLYLWGPVGRGKTTLMDLFYECLPFEHKQRTHFHRFMHRVHEDLASVRGHRAPLQVLADRLAARARVLCFDEFEVTDIGDAMILAGLLQALFDRGVMLVATSNMPPERLYEHGLQRERFLPAIALILRHTNALKLDGNLDYRPRRVDRAAVYHVPCDAASNQAMLDRMREISSAEPRFSEVLEIQHRPVHTVACTPDAVWLEFAHICEAPRGKGDYIELARRYATVMISDVPVLDGRYDALKRFISLVDEFYDRGVKLVISAAEEAHVLYSGKRMKREFARAASRLTEMQSQHYLSRARPTGITAPVHADAIPPSSRSQESSA